MKDNIILFLLGGITGALFFAVHTPLPWTLGPLCSTLVWKLMFNKRVAWPKTARNGGLVILGYAMGSPFTVEIGHQILKQLPGMLLSTTLILFLSLAVGWVTSRRTGVGMVNGLLGSIPGGFSQMAVLCEEVRGADVAVVSLMQLTRILTIVFVVPLLAIYGFPHGEAVQTAAGLDTVPLSTIAMFGGAVLLSLPLAALLRFPTPYLMGPVLGTIVLIMCGYEAPHMPKFLLALAQITIGVRMGADISCEGLHNWKSIVLHSFVSVALIITLALGIDYTLVKLYGMSFLTAFISTAPGGMAEMGITALAVNADISIVVAYQLFRLLAILVLLIPALKWWLQGKLSPLTR